MRNQFIFCACAINNNKNLPFQPLQNIIGLFSGVVDHLKNKSVGPLKRVVWMIRTVTICMRKSHLASICGANKWFLSSVKPLMGFQLAALCEGFCAPREITGVRSFSCRG